MSNDAMPRATPGSRYRRLAALASTLLLARPEPVSAQAGKSPERLPSASTEVVRIDVVVSEKGGRPRLGLTEKDFVVLEDGQAQDIVRFEAFASPAGMGTTTTPGAAAPTPAAPAADAPPARAARRHIVLAVDDLHIEVANLVRTKKALDRFVERELLPEDRFALVTTSGALAEDFTGDAQVLKAAVARLSPRRKGSGRAIRAPYIDEYQAELILRDDPDALSVAVEEILNERFDPSPESEARMVARMVFDESFDNARRSLESLLDLVRRLGQVPGRKVVVFASDGFLTGLGVQAGGAFDLQQVTDAGTRAGVVIYALDTRGLVANTVVGGSASSRRPVNTATFSQRNYLQKQGEQATRQAMNALAADTGGLLIEDSNDLPGGLRKILKDTETYYAIAYEPKNTKRDGAFRKIEVKLPGVRDVRIRARKGYYAPDDRKPGPAIPPTTTADTAAPPDPRVSELQAALTSAEAFGAVSVRLSADFVSADAAQLHLVMSGNVDVRALASAPAGDRRTTIDVAAAIFDESGVVVGTIPAERAEIDLAAAGAERSLQHGLPYQKAVPVKPGRYRVRVAAREDAGGKLGSAVQWVEVPDLATGPLALSSVFLLRNEADPGKDLVLASAQALRRFKRAESLYVQVYAYNARRDGSGAANLVTQAEIWRAGSRLGATPPEPMAVEEAGAPPVPHTQSFKLASFEPGEYEVRMVVTDRQAGTTAIGRATFAVE